MPDRWEIVQNTHGHPLLADILMIHIVLLPSGKVLGFSGSEHDEKHHKKFRSVLWDPANPHVLKTLDAPHVDFFCAGHALLADGRVLVAGGTANYNREPGNPHKPYHFTGIADCYTFDWRTNTWLPAAPMHLARWYPTLITLADGRVLSLGGHGGPDLPSHEVLQYEVYQPDTDRWEPARDTVPPLEDTGKFRILWWKQFPMIYYARLHVLGDGRVFSSTALQLVGGKRRTCVLDPDTGVLSVVGPPPRGMLVAFMRNVYSRSHFTSALLPLKPPHYRQEVLIAGGRRARRFDLGAAKRRWRRAGRPRPYKMRAYATSLLLPDGSVLCIGGGESEKVPRWYWPWSEHGGYDRDSNPVPERYLPDQDAWVSGAAPADYPPIPRMYHTAAVLLPSGEVLICASNKDSQRNSGGSRPDHGHHGEDARELRLEVYSPSYLFDAAGKPAVRPVVELDALAAESAGYAEDLVVTTAQPDRIRRVTMIRCSSVTHAYTSDQRLIELTIGSRGAGQITVTTPPNRRIAVPGYYLIFALDAAGVPSHGQYLRLT